MLTELPTSEQLTDFQNIVWRYYRDHGRDSLPWRSPAKAGEIDPYHVLVSELMLQQTQVKRVESKFHEFLSVFPTITSLSQAPLSRVLILWSGLGYNRRAKFLHASAQEIVRRYNGHVPRTTKELVELPGIGPNTAAAIVAYSFNEPVVFIETNIRAVFIHHFFAEVDQIIDSQILELVEATLDVADPRQWYWALMDYGSHLKATLPNPSRRSKHHTVQSSFAGSRRQVRGQVLKLLLEEPLTLEALKLEIIDERLDSVLADLLKEELISLSDTTYVLGK